MMLPPMGAFLKAGRAQSDLIDTMSVVIPCLNDANSRGFCVAEAVNAFPASALSGEVIETDNGSSDGSIQIAEEHGARVVRAPERRCGSALRGDIAAAGGPLIMGDADPSYDLSEVRRFVDRFDLLRRRR